jgi:hypothetical protein
MEQKPTGPNWPLLAVIVVVLGLWIGGAVMAIVAGNGQ